MRSTTSFALTGLTVAMAGLCLASDPAASRYAGPEACSRCHKEIAAAQIETAMANTWRGASAPSLPATFDQKKTEGPDAASHYEIRRVADRFQFSVLTPFTARMTLPVEAIVGGKRHGLSFLARIQQIDGIPLERPALIEARYAYAPLNALVLSPGFLNQKPSDLEDSLGRVLSPAFEQRCLRCHGEPNTLGAGQHGGVRCESCHGPASAHIDSMQGPGRQLVRPERLAGVKAMTVCAQCHTGLSTANHSDPLPDDLLVSSQVPALRHSECFIQSEEGVSCTDCHNPHADSPRIVETSVQTCLRCHSLKSAKETMASGAPPHAAICPINATSDCIQCHMPSIESNAFRLTDHWIRVHPEQGIQAAKHNDSVQTLVPAKREYLQILITDNKASAEAALKRLNKGDSFYDVAHDLSIDPTAPGGGYIGEVKLAEMDASLAAACAHLSYGQTTGIIEQGNRCVLLHRLPRDFKWSANRLYEQAVALRKLGDRSGAIAKDQAALKIYPYFLRALVFMGAAIGEAGDSARASEILSFAVQSYPDDAAAQFDLALTLSNQPARQIQAFRRAIELDPEMIAAYQNLGAALASAGQVSQAIEVFHQGLAIDPLSAILNYDLGLALERQNDHAGALRAFTLAAKVDPEIAVRLQATRGGMH